MKKYLVKFAYSGSNSREFFEIEFSDKPCQYSDNPNLSITERISQYVSSQNKGEAKSDRIRYWSKQVINPNS